MIKHTVACLSSIVMVHFAAIAAAAPANPAVYEDDYVVVRASIQEVGRQVIHLGDLLTLEVQVEFDESHVRIEQLDADYFHRNFSDQTGVALSVGPKGDTPNASWSFQILGCPASLEPCPDTKIYEVPVFTLAYQIIDKSGRVLNNKAARFRPWPEKIAVLPSLPEASTTAARFVEFFPSGAWPEPLAVSIHSTGPVFTVIAGALLLLFSFRSEISTSASHLGRQDNRPTQKRWETLFETLGGDSLDDAQWADALRRCVSWFCLDELDINPYEWVSSYGSINVSQQNSELQTLFVEVANYGRIDSRSRDRFLKDFALIVKKTGGLTPGDSRGD